MSRKQVLSLISAIALLLGLLSGTALAEPSGDNTCAVIGADLTQEEILSIYQSFEIERGSVQELRMTNKRERADFDGIVDPAIIGTKSISCVLFTLTEKGSGLKISTDDTIIWVTPEMMASSLTTAGITDATIAVSAPFPVSGTSALSGVFLAYETLTGKSLNPEAKRTALEEVTMSGKLQEELDSGDTSRFLLDLKSALSKTKTMTDAELTKLISETAAQYHIALSDDQLRRILSLCRSLEELDDGSLEKRIEQLRSAIDTANQAKATAEEVSGKIQAVASSFNDFFEELRRFFGKSEDG